MHNKNNQRLESGKLATIKQVMFCHLIIHIASVMNAVIGAIPLMIADSILIGVVQVIMIVLLGRVFEQKLSLSLFKGFIIWLAASFLGRNLVQLVPVVGWVVSASVALIVTEVVGWGIQKEMAECFRLEWRRRKSAKEAATAYAEAEYYKQAFESDTHTDSAEDFSNVETTGADLDK